MSMEKQRDYLTDLEREINGFEGASEPRERQHAGIIRQGLERVRKRIHEDNEWWGNEPKLKELESRFEKLLQATTLTKH
jgi:hypothetical protein